jgi:hypothetical protein
VIPQATALSVTDRIPSVILPNTKIGSETIKEILTSEDEIIPDQIEELKPEYSEKVKQIINNYIGK